MPSFFLFVNSTNLTLALVDLVQATNQMILLTSDNGTVGHHAFAGAIVNPQSLVIMEYLQYCILVVHRASGTISHFYTFETPEELITSVNEVSIALSLKPEDWTLLNSSQFLVPGFVDMHTHAPQFRNLGRGLDYALLEWLDSVTFPEERWFTKEPEEDDADYYGRVASIYRVMAKCYLRNGTTTCCYFGSLQLSANCILVDQVAASGQRALIGKVCMDCNSPSFYVEETAQNVDDTLTFINYIKEVDAKSSLPGRILPVVTPRFALTCTEGLMKELAQLATTHNCHIQTHMSENKNEILFAQELFPNSQNYAHIYEEVGLLGPKTILAHCIHLTPDKTEIIKKHDCAIAHCPNSNFALNSGVLNIRSVLADGIRVGLGSDVSGGYSVSILDAMRQAIIASKSRYFEDPSNIPLKVNEVFYLATLGGAKALGMDAMIGNFAVGKRFDALLIDSSVGMVPARVGEGLEDLLSRLVFTGDDRWINRVYVDGQPIALK